MKEQPKQSKRMMDIVDVEKLYAQYQAGLSIRKLSLLWKLPYASLYRALKKVEAERKKNGRDHPS